MNKIEAIKQAKDGLDVLPDLYRYAVTPDAEIPADDLERLKWYGLFHRKATPGYFMLRIRVPNGILSSEQLAAVADISERYGRGQADLTTRQGIQLRWITIQDAPDVLQRLYAVGLTPQQSGMDNVRNVVGCPVAGIDADALIDARPLTARLQQAIVGRREFSNLPRKVNLSITGCREDCAHAQAQDVAFVAATGPDGLPGFNVLVGGALGGKAPRLAEPLDVFVDETEVVPTALAILRVFRDHGLRENRQRARLKFLLAEWGIARFRAAVAESLGAPLREAGTPASALHGGDHIGIREQPTPGRACVGLMVPVGRITADQLREVARLADDYGQSEIRLTVQQNVLIPHVAMGRLPVFLQEPLLEALTPNPSDIMRGLVSCTGNDYCHFSLIDTKGEALRLAEQLEAKYEVTRPVRLSWSGCPHSCGQHRIADVGFQGARVRQGDAIVPAASITAGGRLGANARLGIDIAENVPTDDLVEIVAREIGATLGADAIRPRAIPAGRG